MNTAQIASQLQGPKALPARPGFAEGCGVLRINCQNAAAAEPPLQQLHAVAPDCVKGCPADAVAGLLWVHAGLEEDLCPVDVADTCGAGDTQLLGLMLIPSTTRPEP